MSLEITKEDLVQCAKCGKDIEPKEKAVGLDDAEWYHIACAAKMLKYRCAKCGYMYNQKPDDMTCDALEGCNSRRVKFIRSLQKRLNIMKRWALSPYE